MAGTRKPKETPEDQPKVEAEKPATAAETTPEPEAVTPPAAEPEAEAPKTDEPAEAEVEAAVEEAAEAPSPEAEPEPEAEPTPEPPAPEVAQPQPAPKRGGGWIGSILGGVIAAVIGFGAANYVVPQGWPFGPASQQIGTLSQRLAAEDTALNAAKAELASVKSALNSTQQVTASLGARLKKAEDAANAAASQVDGLKGQIAALKTANTDLGDRVTKLEARPLASSGGSGSADASAVLGALRSQIADQKKANADLSAQIKALSDKANARIDAAEQQAKAAKAQAEATSKSALAQVALTRVQTALDLGGPFAAPLSMLSSQGLSVPAALSGVASSGVATQSELQTAFVPAARAALDASIKATMGKGIGSRALAFLRTQVGLRSLTPRQGSGPDAVLSRAGADVQTGDLAAALKEIATLPPAGQTAMQDWTAKAKARLAAETAMTALAQTIGKN